MVESKSSAVIDDFRGAFAFLSNFFTDADGFCVENVYQAAKTADPAEREWVLTSPDPGTAKRRGRRVKLRDGWEKSKISVMRRLLKIKFERPAMRDALLATEDAILVEGNTWGDTFWGQSPVGRGKNILGQLLMELRASLST